MHVDFSLDVNSLLQIANDNEYDPLQRAWCLLELCKQYGEDTDLMIENVAFAQELLEEV